MNHKPYPKYKESGVQWLGQVPGHWQVWKLSHGFQNTGSGTTPPSDNDVWYEGDIPWITTSELRESIIFDTTKKVSENALTTFSALKLFPEGSLVIAMYGATIGRLGILGVPATTNQACCVMYGERVLKARFMFLWFQAFREQVILLASGGGQPNISQDKIRSIRVACPPLPEQTVIADFLHRETGRINTLVAKKRRLIALLGEKRTALISRTVTRGLPADAAREFGLAPHTRFKDSGIEWLGELPEGWHGTTLKRVVSVCGRIGFRGYTTEDLVDEDEGALVLGGTNLTKIGQLDLTKRTYLSWFKYEESPEIKVKFNDLVIGQRGTCGKVVLINQNIGPATINPSLVLLKEPKIHSGFLCYWLMGEYIQSIFSSYLSATAVPMLSQQQIGNVPVCHPDIQTQTAIATYLDRKTTKIDQLIAKVEAAIARLQEYRIALITAAVTGKIDVRPREAP